MFIQAKSRQAVESHPSRPNQLRLESSEAKPKRSGPAPFADWRTTFSKTPTLPKYVCTLGRVRPPCGGCECLGGMASHPLSALCFLYCLFPDIRQLHRQSRPQGTLGNMCTKTCKLRQYGRSHNIFGTFCFCGHLYPRQKDPSKASKSTCQYLICLAWRVFGR